MVQFLRNKSQNRGEQGKVKLLKRIYLCFAYFMAISGFIVTSMSFNFVSWTTLKFPRIWGGIKNFRNLLQFYFIRWDRLMMKIGVLNLYTPQKTEPKDSNGEMWLCNHPTILDGSYLLKFITNGTCVYKSAIGSNPLYGSTVKIADYIPNVGGPDMVRNAANKLKSGQDMVIFPEGTRSTRLDTSLFKPGFALIAKRAEANINLLWTDNPQDFLTRESPYWKAPRLPATINITHFKTIHCTRKSSVKDILKEVIEAYETQAALNPVK